MIKHIKTNKIIENKYIYAIYFDVTSNTTSPQCPPDLDIRTAVAPPSYALGVLGATPKIR